METDGLVSVIIPTKNSGATLDRCLLSFSRQSYSNFEIILVDNFSKDNTVDISSKYSTRLIQTRAARTEARNIGAASSAGEWILSLDSDMEVSPTVIEECVTLSRVGYDAIIIPEASVGEGFWAKCKALEKSAYIGDDLIEASRFFKRSIFEAVGGYDFELEAGEDWDLNQRIRRAGHNIGRISTMVLHHEGELSLAKTIMKKHRYGKTIKRYRQRHPREADAQLSFIRLSFLKNWRLLARDPLHSVGLIVMKACELGALMLGERLTPLRSSEVFD